jgi:phospholipase C
MARLTRKLRPKGGTVARAMGAGVIRRDVLRAGIAGGAALALAPLDTAGVIERALATAPAGCGRLQDIEHIVIFVQENRSMDCYFGTYKGVRGFGDKDGLFAQPGYPREGGSLRRLRRFGPSAQASCPKGGIRPSGQDRHLADAGAISPVVLPA